MEITTGEIRITDNQLDAESKRSIISGLKAVKEAQNLTIKDIQQMVKDATGLDIAPSTLYRVFAEDAENDSFSYVRTLQPIERALLVHNESTADAVVRAQLDTYLHICQYKMEVIESLHEQIEKLKEDLLAKSEDYNRRVAFLRDQIELKDTRMDRKDETIEKLLDQLLVCKDCVRRKG